MAKQVQLRRGTTAELSSVTGAAGEVIVDTTKDTLTVHDAYTAGGIPLLREDLGNLADQSIPTNKIIKGAANQVLVTNAAGTGVEWGYNKLVGIRYYTNSTRTSLSDSGNYVFWSITDNKVRDDTNILVVAFLPGFGNYSGMCGPFVGYDGTRQWSVNYIYDENATGKQISGQAVWTGKLAGARTIQFGWQTNDGTTGNKPFNVWNPNASDDARQPQTTSYAVVYEYLA